MKELLLKIRDAAPAAIMRARRSVRGKLMAIVLMTTALALLVAGTATLTYDIKVYRQSWAFDLWTEARILALSTAPALAFDDHGVAERNLAALEARPALRVAALYTPGGKLYAAYVRAGAAPPPAQTIVPADGVHMSGERVELVQRIVQNGETLGSIYLQARYDVMGRVEAYLEIFALVTALSMGAALTFSRLLQSAITQPLDAMANVARQIVDRRDYSLRAQKKSQDEIGLVVDAFNSMLTEVQSRTRALELSNAALKDEVRVRQAAENALWEADRRKDEFLATLAHELRNPLAPIRHAVKILEATAVTDRQRQWGLEVIARQAHRMALLLEDLLDVSRITRGRLELKKDCVELQHLVDLAVETARPLLESKRHVLEIVLPAEPVQLEVDPLRLSQALSNLLTNAAKYTDAEGRVRLTVRLLAEQITMSVKDTGIGFAPTALPKLFEMFSQVDSAVDRAEGGLGIGLALVKGLIALHGGTVEAASEGPGLGSEFTIHLPRTAVVTQRPEPRAQMPARRAEGRLFCKVLVADDNRDAADSLALLLEMSGHSVRVAHSGQAALEIGSRERPDAVILDIGMPDVSGYDVARRIRKEPWGRTAFLLAITGWGQENDKERARAAGFDQHLTKPVDPDQVGRLLIEYLERRTADRKSQLV